MSKIDMSKVGTELLRTLMKCENFEEFLKHVKENKLEYSDEEAKEIFDILKKDLVEFSEEELLAVSGGIGTNNGGQKRINRAFIGTGADCENNVQT